MPTVSLRLTVEELAALRAWAYDGRRSLQKEIVWRLFSAEAVGAAKVGVATGVPRVGVSVPADGSVHTVVGDGPAGDAPSRSRRVRTEMCEHRRRPDEFCPRCDNGEE